MADTQEAAAGTAEPFVIGIAVWQGVDLIDMAAPREIFNFMGIVWSRPTTVLLVAASDADVVTRDGLKFRPEATFESCPRLDLLFVPGGDPDKLQHQILDCEYLDYIRRASQEASYTVSVCEGALLLASAGLLDGFEATTHWSFIPHLKMFPKVTVAPEWPRFVVSRNGYGIRVTGGGISSGFDECLEVVALVTGSEDVAKRVQLYIQYNPKPPFVGGDPSVDPTAPKPTVSDAWKQAIDEALSGPCG